MTEAPTSTRVVRFAGATTVPVPLADPLEVDGKTLNEIHVSKLTVGSYRRHTEASGRSEVLSLPMYHDGGGVAVPEDVLDALSFRDAQSVMEVASGFLNASPKAGAETSASA